MSYFLLKMPNTDGVDLHICVRAVTVKKVKHPFKAVVPQKPPIDMSDIDRNGERSCLKCDKNDFDPESEYTYLLVSGPERASGKKE
jgi:hypothetical protein